jgi:hypothetical protein
VNHRHAVQVANDNIFCQYHCNLGLEPNDTLSTH